MKKICSFYSLHTGKFFIPCLRGLCLSEIGAQFQIPIDTIDGINRDFRGLPIEPP